MPIDSRILQAMALFDSVPQDRIAFAAERARQRTFHHADETIVHEGDPGETFYMIQQGTVKIRRTMSDGRIVFIALLAAGDTFGELSLIDTDLRSADVITQEKTVLVSFDRTTFDTLVDTAPIFTRNLMKTLSRRLRLANGRIQALSTEDVDGRVVRQLWEFSTLYGKPQPDGSVVIPVRLTQSDVADLVGASRERVNQVMVFYRDKGAISVDAGYRITIRRPQEFAKRFQ